MYKKILLLILIIISILIRITIGIKILNLITKDNNIDDRYYYSEVFGERYCLKECTVYNKYYYKSKSDEFFSKRYNKVNNSSTLIKTYYKEFKDYLKAVMSSRKYNNKIIEVPFFDEKINKDDYFKVYDDNSNEKKRWCEEKDEIYFHEFTLYYYNIRKHILYVLKFG